jgi:hypothetical protein
MTSPLRALYYPYSRSLSATTLKRSVLLYDEILFVDPMSARARNGLYDPSEHLQYLPPDAASSLASEWLAVRDEYSILQREGLLRLVDPEPTLADPATGQLIADALGADLAQTDVRGLFGAYPRMWSMLRTRIPSPAFAHLAHQLPARVLGSEPVIAGTDGPLALYLDGHPKAMPTLGGVVLPDGGREYAALLPYVAGSSLATSTALAIALDQQAVPLTDSDPHFRLLSMRMARAATAASASDVPGLHKRGPSAATAQRTALVHQRVVDSVISYEDLAAMTLADCLRYREATNDQRVAFRQFLGDVVEAVYAQPWSPEIEQQIEARIADARRDIGAHAKKMRETYRSLFGRMITGLAVSAAPALLTMAFPGVSPLMALLFGAGPLGALLSDPVKEIAAAWIERDRGTSSLAYLMDLPRAT